MLHCTPETTLKPTRLKFTPETAVSNVVVTQVCWEAVPNTWRSSSITPVTKCVVYLSIDEQSQHIGQFQE